MAGPLRGLRGFARRAKRPEPTRQATVDLRPKQLGTGDSIPAAPSTGGNGAQASSVPAPAQATVPSPPVPAPPGVPPAGSAWPGASPAVAPRARAAAAAPPSPAAPAAAPAAQPTAAPPAATTPPKQPKQPAADDARPATQGQLKSLRRWLMVTAAWAVAATGIAVLAFLSANTDEEQRLAENNAQLKQIEGNMNKRLATVRQQLGALPQANSVTQLGTRVTHLEKVALRNDKSVTRLVKQLSAVSTSLTSLEQTVKVLQASQKSAAGTDTTP